jgi:hypothetical protein
MTLWIETAASRALKCFDLTTRIHSKQHRLRICKASSAVASLGLRSPTNVHRCQACASCLLKSRMPGSAEARRLVRGIENSNHRRNTERVSGAFLNANLQLHKSISDEKGKELNPCRRGSDQSPRSRWLCMRLYRVAY